MERCYFAKEPPEVEVRGDLIFIHPSGAHCEIAMSAETLGAFVARANRALDRLYERSQAGVVPIRAPH